MTENLSLWQLVEKTPPEYTKAITGKPYKGNSPKPHYLVQKATETFGPCGIGWGFQIVSDRIEDGAPGDRLHIIHLRVWYVWKDKRGEVEHVGQTMFCGKNKNGPYTDEDAPKKSVTDALVKALSMIGFAGDIFMGHYDDSKYVAELKREADEDRRQSTVTPPSTPFDQTDGDDAATRYIASTKSLIDAEGDPGSLIKWWNSDVRKKEFADFELRPDEVSDLKSCTMKRIEALSPQRESAQ